MDSSSRPGVFRFFNRLAAKLGPLRVLYLFKEVQRTFRASQVELEELACTVLPHVRHACTSFCPICGTAHRNLRNDITHELWLVSLYQGVVLQSKAVSELVFLDCVLRSIESVAAELFDADIKCPQLYDLKEFVHMLQCFESQLRSVSRGAERIAAALSRIYGVHEDSYVHLELTNFMIRYPHRKRIESRPRVTDKSSLSSSIKPEDAKSSLLAQNTRILERKIRTLSKLSDLGDRYELRDVMALLENLSHREQVVQTVRLYFDVRQYILSTEDGALLHVAELIVNTLGIWIVPILLESLSQFVLTLARSVEQGMDVVRVFSVVYQVSRHFQPESGALLANVLLSILPQYIGECLKVLDHRCFQDFPFLFEKAVDRIIDVMDAENITVRVKFDSNFEECDKEWPFIMTLPDLCSICQKVRTASIPEVLLDRLSRAALEFLQLTIALRTDYFCFMEDATSLCLVADFIIEKYPTCHEEVVKGVIIKSFVCFDPPRLLQWIEQQPEHCRRNYPSLVLQQIQIELDSPDIFVHADLLERGGLFKIVFFSFFSFFLKKGKYIIISNYT